jgi:hypothetical protein
MKQLSTIPASEPVCDLYRILLFRDPDTILFKEQNGCSSLPTVEVPRGERATSLVNREVRRRLQLDVYSLFRIGRPTTTVEQQRIFFQVMQAGGFPKALPNSFRWHSATNLIREALSAGDELEMIPSAVRQMERYRTEAEFAPFGRASWLEELLLWIQQKTTSLDITLSGKVEQFNASPHFALLHIETNHRAMWFKATGEPNRHELGLSETLFRYFPAFVPEIIAVHREWNGWLTWEADGVLLESCCSIEGWVQAADQLARLQIASIGHPDDLRHAGAKDLRTSRLLSQLPPFIARMKDLMAQQQSGPQPMSERELDILGEHLTATLEGLDELEIPDSLGHLDFNPGNILVARDHCTFLDWAEGCVGNPFLTFEYLRLHYARSEAARPGGESQLIQAYIGPWQKYLPEEAIRKSLAYARLIAVFAFAVTCVDGGSAAYLRSLTRRMRREADPYRV